jgi:hypothetical protein
MEDVNMVLIDEGSCFVTLERSVHNKQQWDKYTVPLFQGYNERAHQHDEGFVVRVTFVCVYPGLLSGTTGSSE